jgi:gamma-tubulin complex component 5
MSCQPNPETHEIAHEYLHRQPAEIVDQDRLLFDEIMADPFEGDHWGKGYDSEVREGWTDSDSNSSGDEREKIVTPLRERVGVAHAQARVDIEQEGVMRMREAEERMRRLGEGYWVTGGKVVERAEVGEGWRAISTGLSAASLAIAVDGDAKLGVKVSPISPEPERCLIWLMTGSFRSAVSERIAVCSIWSTWTHARFLPGRNVLRKFPMLDVVIQAERQIVSDHPTVIHYSPLTVTSILENIRSRATQASLIRRYIQSTLSPVASSSHHAPSKISQAFAEACRVYINKFDAWIAEIEIAFVRGLSSPYAETGTTSTPLVLQRQLDERYGTMIDCLSAVLPHAGTPNDLLNALYSMLTSIPQYRSELLQVFITTASPVWAMLGDWLNRGMPIPRSLIDLDTLSDDERRLDNEFWVYRDQDVSWADEDFWEAAFLLREERPAWIDGEVLELVLEAGKARGLLRGLRGREIDTAAEGWVSLNELAGQGDVDHFDLVDVISNHLTPICQLTTFHLRRTLDEDCGLQAHLEAIDGLFYLRGFSTLQPWTEWLFTQVSFW